MGRLEIVRGELRRRQLKLLHTAINGYATRIFGSEGIAALPAAVGQAGIGKKTITKELAIKADQFSIALREFADHYLPPPGWIVVVGGRLGFAMRYSKGCAAIFRATSALENEPAAARRSCIIIVYKAAPASISYQDKTSICLQRQRIQRMIKKVDTKEQSQEVEKNNLNHDVTKTTEEEEEEEEEEHCNKNEHYESSPNNKLIAPQKHFKITKLISINPLVEKNGLSYSNKREQQQSPSKTCQESSSINSVIDSTCPRWGLLSKDVQLREANNVFQRLVDNPSCRDTQDTQLFAQTLREELTLASGLLWHVYVSLEDVIVNTSYSPSITLHAEWTCNHRNDIINDIIINNNTSENLETPIITTTTTQQQRSTFMHPSKFKIIAFQLWGQKQPLTLWEKITSLAPYAAICFLLFFWMIKSRLCDDNETRPVSKFQRVVSSRICNHKGLEITTLLLFIVFVLMAVGKILRRLL